MSALILIELNGSEVSANSRAALTAALQLSDSVDALVLTNDSANASAAASMAHLLTVKIYCHALAPSSMFSLSRMSVRLNHQTHLSDLCMLAM